MNKRLLRLLCLIVSLMILCCFVLGACKDDPAEETHDPLNDLGEATLTISGAWEECRAIETLAADFSKKYPKCTIVYEVVQDYYNSVSERMDKGEKIDMFFTTNVRPNTMSKALYPYVLDLKDCAGIDLSNTFDGLIKNFTFSDEEGVQHLTTLPVGAEMRGMYVNMTLLKECGVALPTNQATLLAACETFKTKGYTAFGGNPANFGTLLIYPWIANLIVNSDKPTETYNKINTRATDAWDVIDDPYRFLYTLVENDYYDYKALESADAATGRPALFNDGTDEMHIRSFLNIQSRKEGEDTVYYKGDGAGFVPFMPYTLSLKSKMDEMAADYHCDIEYQFIPSPVGTDGGFVYLSPAHGIAINKHSDNLEWAKGFMNFMFQKENNVKFAESFNCIPNTKDAFDFLKRNYNVPESRISEVGQATFDYNFYSEISHSKSTIISLSKANAPKYLKNKDAYAADTGSPRTVAKELYPIDYFLDMLKTDLEADE